MDPKLIIVLLIAINCYPSCGAALRRTPKVYNALITSDENLTSSRAFPVIQPTIHESGIAHYPFGPYNPYGSYPYGSPPLVRFGQPIAPGFAPRPPLPYHLPQSHFQPQLIPRPYPSGFQGYPPGHNPPTAPPAPEQAEQQPQMPTTPQELQQPQEPPTPTEQQQAVQPPNSIRQSQGPNYMPIEENRPQPMPNEKLPLPLNEYGLPPALIPLPQYGPPNRHRSPVHLPPYGYNQYPLVYDPVTGFREQYLPPYEYYPSPQTFAVGPSAAAPPKKPQPILPAPTPAPSMTTASEEQPTTDVDDTENDNDDSLPLEPTEPSFETIKNGSKSKDSGIPDVPPPPIPSGAKSKQS